MYNLGELGIGAEVGAVARAWVGAETWASAEVGEQKTANIGVRVPLLLMRALGASLVSSSLPVRAELQQVHGLAIWLAWWVISKNDYKDFVFSKQAG